PVSRPTHDFHSLSVHRLRLPTATPGARLGPKQVRPFKTRKEALSIYVWRLLYPRAARLGFLKKKGRKKRAEPKTRIGSVSCPVASSPDPNARLKFEKPALDLSASDIRYVHITLMYRT